MAASRIRLPGDFTLPIVGFLNDAFLLIRRAQEPKYTRTSPTTSELLPIPPNDESSTLRFMRTTSPEPNPRTKRGHPDILSLKSAITSTYPGKRRTEAAKAVFMMLAIDIFFEKY
jgi:hypothetical protein